MITTATSHKPSSRHRNTSLKRKSANDAVCMVHQDMNRTNDLLAEKERLVQEEADLVHRLVSQQYSISH